MVRELAQLHPAVLARMNAYGKTPLSAFVASEDGSPLHQILMEDDPPATLEMALSAASDILRYLFRHYPSLATAKNSGQQTLYDLLPAEDAGLTYARRLGFVAVSRGSAGVELCRAEVIPALVLLEDAEAAAEHHPQRFSSSPIRC